MLLLVVAPGSVLVLMELMPETRITTLLFGLVAMVRSLHRRLLMHLTGGSMSFAKTVRQETLSGRILVLRILLVLVVQLLITQLPAMARPTSVIRFPLLR
jgi:hypothetical protein